MVCEQCTSYFDHLCHIEPGPPQKVEPDRPVCRFGKTGKKRTLKQNDEPDYTPEYLRFYEIYPRKEAKQDGFAAWSKRNITEELVNKIMAAIKEQSKIKGWDKTKAKDKKYIPLPASWLNAGRWTDQVQDETVLLKKQAQKKYIQDSWNNFASSNTNFVQTATSERLVSMRKMSDKRWEKLIDILRPEIKTLG